MSQSISVVVLGDAGVGKTDLLTRLTSNDAPQVGYQPTIGADLSSSTYTLQEACGTRREINVNFWEFPGNERFLPPFGSQLIQADICLLVCDVCLDETLDHLDKWHDEYLQSHFGGVAPASFILVANKTDITDHRKINSDALAGWCSREMIDPTLWLKEVTGEMLPTPPFVEVSARTGAGIELLKGQILQRGQVRAGLNIQLPLTIPSIEQDLTEHDSIAKGAVRCIFMGESESARDSLLLKNPSPGVVQVERIERSAASFTSIRHTNLAFAIWTAPNTQTSGPMWYCRGSHVCLMTLHLGIQAVTHRLALWKEIFLRESCLRDASGILWVVVGKRTAAYIQEASIEASEYCQRNGYNFIDLPEDPTGEYMLSVWDSIASLAENHRRDRIIERTEEQVRNLIQRRDRIIEKTEEQVRDLIADCPNKENGWQWRGKACDAPHHIEQKRNEVADHIQGDAPRHTELLSLLSTGLQHLRTNMLSMEGNHTIALQELKEAHQSERTRLQSELQSTRDELNEARSSMKDMRIEMNLMWQELEALKTGRTI